MERTLKLPNKKWVAGDFATDRREQTPAVPPTIIYCLSTRRGFSSFPQHQQRDCKQSNDHQDSHDDKNGRVNRRRGVLFLGGRLSLGVNYLYRSGWPPKNFVACLAHGLPCFPRWFSFTQSIV